MEVDFNSLAVVVNLESWVMVLDFFGAKNEVSPKSKKSHKHYHHKKPDPAPSPGYQNWSKAAQGRSVNSRWEVEVRSLNLLLNRKEYEVAEATISNLTWEMACMRGNLDVNGKLGSITVNDLTAAGRMYKERFLTSGNEALDFQFFAFSADDPHLARDYDVRLNLNMASVMYVHTQRFYAEFFAVIQQFNQLRRNIADPSHPTSPTREPWRHGTRVLLNVEAGSPVILVPVCSTSEHLLVIDLGKITVSNYFNVSNGSMSLSVKDSVRSSGKRNLPVIKWTDSSTVLVDVIKIELSSMDICTGLRLKVNRSQVGDLILGSYLVRRSGQSLLKETCEMSMEVRRNLDTHMARPIADIDLCGLLSTVECSVNEYQYKLIRGLLSFNLGENLNYLKIDTSAVSTPVSPTAKDFKPAVWSTLKLRIDLVNVVLEVKESRVGTLSTIKFIDSRLIYESNSDGSKDVDLVSQQVVLRDTRYDSTTSTTRGRKKNVFTQILSPVMQAKREGTLQAEVHYRSTGDFTRFTIVLNNMRLLAVFDWWLQFREFIVLSPDDLRGEMVPESVCQQISCSADDGDSQLSTHWTAFAAKPSPIIVSTGVISKRAAVIETPYVPVEFKINISDSEVVIIEDSSAKDSSAVILKGTAILAYRPQIHSKPLSCQLNRVEIFSSQLCREEETALSIVDPATISLEVVGKSGASDTKGILEATSLESLQTLEIQAQQLILRLSYNDMKLFLRILDSVPRQLRDAPSEVPFVTDIEKLLALGFARLDCEKALEECSNNLEEAALWLTQNASAIPAVLASRDEMKIRTLELRTGCISLCVIDDCRDADVPLLEVTTSQLLLRQSIDALKISGEGFINCQFAIEYYNRILSGWEPFVEPFKCHLKWNFLPFKMSAATDLSTPSQKRLIVFDTEDVVNVNFTQSLLELFKTVKLNWTEDYYGAHCLREDSMGSQTDNQSISSTVSIRHRSPFVPFALQNATGSRLKFRTLTASLLADNASVTSSSRKVEWIYADAGEVIAFNFENRGKLRHRDSHEMQTHQIAIEIDGWMELVPVSVDRVGVYFRYAMVLYFIVRFCSCKTLYSYFRFRVHLLG